MKEISWVFTFYFMVLQFCCCEQLDEELLIKDLGNGFTSFHFNFVEKSDLVSHRHFDLLPRYLLQIVDKYGVSELHLSVSRGFWDERWGSNFVMVSPTGAELWAWFKNDRNSVNQAWFEVTHALSGLFCTSLNRLSTAQHFITPSWSYRPYGSAEMINNTINGQLRYSQLPGESLCSENLTPWAKFLPCKKLAGLGSLLKPTSLFKSTYSALTVGMRQICVDVPCSRVVWEVAQTLTVVFDRRHIYTSLQLSWTIGGMFGTEIRGICKAAHSSRIFIINSNSRMTVSKINLQQSSYSDKRVLAAYSTDNLVQSKSTLRFMVNKPTHSETDSLPFISTNKFVTGSGDVRGGVKILLTNRADFPIKIICLDLIPWYTQVFYSSLNIYSARLNSSEQMKIIADKITIKPSLARQRMGYFELVLILSAKTQTVVSYDFRKPLQQWNEFPPDANRGFLLPSAIVSYQLNKKQLASLEATESHKLTLPNWASTYSQLFNESDHVHIHRPGDGFVRLYTPVSLVTMPTPDFSMPFNVLCIVCSVVAVIFGSIHKSTTTNLIAVSAKSNRISIYFENFKSAFGKREFIFDRKNNEKLRITIYSSDSLNKYGSYTWKCAEILSAYIVQNEDYFHGTTVLELGAGTGLCGLVSALSGAKHVIFTDNEFKCEDNLRRNALLCGVQNFEFHLLDWNDPLKWLPDSFDWILASDCMFDKKVYESFLTTASLLLHYKNKSSLLMTFEHRSSVCDLPILFKKYDLQVRILPKMVSDDSGIYLLQISTKQML